MRVTPVAATTFIMANAEQFGWKYNPEPTHQMDALAEFAGRNCYQSWERPNPATATNEGYLKNILDQGHYSVLEHASVTFFVEDVSRALLTELERHRFISFSVISQRYVDPDLMGTVIPPIFEGDEEAERRVLLSRGNADQDYEWLYDRARAKGHSVKVARGAARAVLPESTEVKMLVTGNIRAWRDVIGKRYHKAADAEIMEFATEVLRWLRLYTPNAVQDIPEQPYA